MKGLMEDEVIKNRKYYGTNEISLSKRNRFIDLFINISLIILSLFTLTLILLISLPSSWKALLLPYSEILEINVDKRIAKRIPIVSK